MCDYDRIQKIVEKKANIFKPSSELQEKLGRIAIMADSSHAIGAMRMVKWQENMQTLHVSHSMQ